MASFAKVALVGNLGADPETKYTPNGTMVVELRVAVNPRQRNQQGQVQGQDEPKPTWYRVSAWDRLADRIDRMTQQGYLAKGRQLYVEGRLEPREFTASDGQVRTSFDVTMTDFQFVGERREGDQAGDGSGGAYSGGSGGGNFGNSGGERTGQDRGTNSNRRQNFNDSPAGDMDDIPF